jgi:hypothetical protein
MEFLEGGGTGERQHACLTLHTSCSVTDSSYAHICHRRTAWAWGTEIEN